VKREKAKERLGGGRGGRQTGIERGRERHTQGHTHTHTHTHTHLLPHTRLFLLDTSRPPASHLWAQLMRESNPRQDRNVRRQIILIAQGVEFPRCHRLPHLAGPRLPPLRARHVDAVRVRARRDEHGIRRPCAGSTAAGPPRQTRRTPPHCPPTTDPCTRPLPAPTPDPPSAQAAAALSEAPRTVHHEFVRSCRRFSPRPCRQQRRCAHRRARGRSMRCVRRRRARRSAHRIRAACPPRRAGARRLACGRGSALPRF